MNTATFFAVLRAWVSSTAMFRSCPAQLLARIAASRKGSMRCAIQGEHTKNGSPRRVTPHPKDGLKMVRPYSTWRNLADFASLLFR